jgi:ATP-dependent RNA helicase DDX56/DBP9
MSSFSSFANILDRRILTALSDLAYSTPTPVQARAIPLALEGKSILARAPTGSGKTAAYCVPLVQAILAAQDIPLQSRPVRATRALILVPTRELADQVSAHLRRLLAYCEKHVTLANLASTTVSQVQKWVMSLYHIHFNNDPGNRHILSDIPDILVATPSRALAVCQANEISLKHIETLVVDEADLIFTYGYQDDLRQLSQDGYLPSVYQSIFMSATLTEDVESLSGLLTINDPVPFH